MLFLFLTVDYDASSAFFQVFSLPGAFQFSLMRKGWYICRSIYKSYHRVAIVTDFNVDSVSWLHRCAFTLRPLRENENAQMNCFESVKPTKPPGILRISSLSTPSTPSPRPTTKPTPHKPEGKIRPGAPNKRRCWSQAVLLTIQDLKDFKKWKVISLIDELLLAVQKC